MLFTTPLSEREYVLAARSLGARTPRVLFQEILPNLVPAMVSVIFTGIAILLAAEGALAFIGYSVKPPSASWGLMIAESRKMASRRPRVKRRASTCTSARPASGSTQPLACHSSSPAPP